MKMVIILLALVVLIGATPYKQQQYGEVDDTSESCEGDDESSEESNETHEDGKEEDDDNDDNDDDDDEDGDDGKWNGKPQYYGIHKPYNRHW